MSVADDLAVSSTPVHAVRWTDLIGEGLGTLARDIGGKGLPAADVIEWFGRMGSARPGANSAGLSC